MCHLYSSGQTLKRAEKEGDHEMERLVKAKIGLQNKLSCLKREMASQLDKDPALAALVAGEIQRTVRTSESGADEASSMGKCESQRPGWRLTQWACSIGGNVSLCFTSIILVSLDSAGPFTQISIYHPARAINESRCDGFRIVFLIIIKLPIDILLSI